MAVPIAGFFNALADPEHAQRAEQARHGRARGRTHRGWRGSGCTGTGLGIGINGGLVCVGEVASDIRRSQTMVGDAVNRASRIEAWTRVYGVDVLVGESMHADLRDRLVLGEVVFASETRNRP
ncbi:adenylate/guanylate cyclase domain-containing protein [uncultured Piscinibacter sp.]|uniref:adenylate/guanylate cyclase domain-containing protein n=1 Tax=uncultured Piscinibacter sp. TaxID=1131835 RepID=UPI00261E9D15|nr:adenylate/guanylate cyclase domain-containing protein [uncultured Piscinibacter sp.]